ncbi:hypothetical protein DFQ04_2627 [Algoriphagus boseongensis]|uniref:Uncharacterized protein n=1 Tax=Algoriphagus boseongensis TaxID=1442587 RepID=A0A4R6T5E3_9BACT|nr:hypothetical protein DFQ04_2627 [Algoriphagus boseongensis]
MELITLVLTIVSVLTGLVGVSIIFWLLFTGLINNDRKKMGKAVKVLFICAGAILIIQIVQFAFAIF